MYKKILPSMLMLMIVLAAVYVTIDRVASPGAKVSAQPAAPVTKEYEKFPPQYPSDLIVEPAKMDKAQSILYPSGLEEIALEYQSKNSASKTAELYRRMLQARQWEVGEPAKIDGSLVLKASRAGASATFTFSIDSPLNTKVEVFYQKHPNLKSNQ